MNNVTSILSQLRALGNPRALEGMSRYGIHSGNAYGVQIPVLRNMAKALGKDHALAQQLWRSGVHEARILAGMVADPAHVAESQANRWAREFDSWDVCDQVCLNLFAHTGFAYDKCREWSSREDEFVKRAAFALMACLAVGDKEASDRKFVPFLRLIEREAVDERNYVKKAVNWALRQIGKRSSALNKLAVRTARRIQTFDSPSARWIASDALRELRSDAVRNRLRNR